MKCDEKQTPSPCTSAITKPFLFYPLYVIVHLLLPEPSFFSDAQSTTYIQAHARTHDNPLFHMSFHGNLCCLCLILLVLAHNLNLVDFQHDLVGMRTQNFNFAFRRPFHHNRGIFESLSHPSCSSAYLMLYDIKQTLNMILQIKMHYTLQNLLRVPSGL